VALLLRIDAEHSDTPAAEKARKRLARFAAEAVNSGELTGTGAESIDEDTSTGTEVTSDLDTPPLKRKKT